MRGHSLLTTGTFILKLRFMMKKLLMLLAGSCLIACGSGPKPDFHENIVIAHRGAWKAKSLPENSIAALEEAIRIGCHGSEFDIHISSDDSLVVNHDPEYFGMVIADTPFRELRTRRLSNGERIPTAREYLLAGLDQDKTKLILEIKQSENKQRTLELTRKAVELVEELDARDMVGYITFDYDAGMLVRQLDPEAEVAYLNGDVTPEKAKEDGYTGLDYHYSLYRKNPQWIPKAHELGMTINAWTVNSVPEMQHLIDQGADYITTNEPELLLSLLRKQ